MSTDVGHDVASLLTIVVTSSPVPSNPDTSTMQAVFRSFALVPGLLRCPKIIQLDGPQRSLPQLRIRSYSEFARRIRTMSRADAAFANTRVFANERFLFASHNLAAAISHVNTSFLFSCQHDYLLARPFDLSGLLRTMISIPVVRHVRLNMRPNYPPRGFDGVIENATLPGLLVPLSRTCGWSDAPHIASVSYYRKFVIPQNEHDHFGGKRKFMEESIHYPMQRNGMPGGCWETKQQLKKGIRPVVWPKNFDMYGTYLYGFASATDGNYMVHRSLRGKEPQWGHGHELFVGGHKPLATRVPGGATAAGDPARKTAKGAAQRPGHGVGASANNRKGGDRGRHAGRSRRGRKSQP